MRVFIKSMKTHCKYVQPGVDEKNITEWFDCNNHPIMFRVVFNNGFSNVNDPLGKYMLDKGLAQKDSFFGIIQSGIEG